MTIDRQLENSFLAVTAADGVPNSYRSSDAREKILPAAIVAARVTGEDYSFKLSGRIASTLELRVTARVSVAAASSAETVEELSRLIKHSVETATGLTGWNYMRLEYEGDERAAESTHREITHIWTVTAHAA
jgi:hypothetical protein